MIMKLDLMGNGKIRIKSKNIWMDAAFTAVSLFMAFILIQLESCSIFLWLGFKKIALNLLIEATLWVILFLIFGKIKFSCLAVLFLNFLVGFINAQVIMFRGNEITINDVQAVRTAISVAGGYGIIMDIRLWIAAVLYVIMVIFISLIEFSKDRYGIKRILISVISAAIMILGVYFASSFYTPFIWKEEGGLYNGILLEWVIELTNNKLVLPENYSEESVKETISRYENLNIQSEENYETPNVIVIMSESYMDPDVLGDIETSREYSAYFDEIFENTVHGYALSSVYGGTTANSEWEFLTGSSMFFLPQGSIPYQQYINSEANSLVRILEAQGYNTLSIHPYKPGGWARDTVYPHLGFDNSLWDSDFQDSKFIREYISDESFYEEIIDTFESKGSSPLFLFGISMQNHGGYAQMDLDELITIENLEGDYRIASEYLTLLSISDEALKKLISYFSDYDEEVVILFFGDHQPYLEEALYEELGSDSLSRYVVPYFIWSNYADLSNADLGLTSFNYLSSIMLNTAGMEMPQYNQALLKIKEEIPVINSECYLKPAGRGWNYEHDLTADSILNDLWTLQYINDIDDKMFSKYRSFFNIRGDNRQ